jgi:TM2 domain-containing membrane protein YozV
MQQNDEEDCLFSKIYMRLISLLILAAVAFSFSCTKNKHSGRCNTYFSITSATTPRTTTVATGITTIVKGYGSTGCHQFTGSEVTNGIANSIEIRIKGTVPCEATICTDVLISARDTIKISTPGTGIYYLKFFSESALFKTDTVLVN